MPGVVIGRETTRLREMPLVRPARLHLVPRARPAHRGPGDLWAVLVLLFCLTFLAG
jgi:hypothetical protein